jgi:hypothetical protein
MCPDLGKVSSPLRDKFVCEADIQYLYVGLFGFFVAPKHHPRVPPVKPLLQD